MGSLTRFYHTNCYFNLFYSFVECHNGFDTRLRFYILTTHLTTSYHFLPRVLDFDTIGFDRLRY